MRAFGGLVAQKTDLGSEDSHACASLQRRRTGCVASGWRRNEEWKQRLHEERVDGGLAVWGANGFGQGTVNVSRTPLSAAIFGRRGTRTSATMSPMRPEACKKALDHANESRVATHDVAASHLASRPLLPFQGVEHCRAACRRTTEKIAPPTACDASGFSGWQRLERWATLATMGRSPLS